ncbi:MAG TPA: serine hydrolase [Selenomonadales bacterium]|nr:serine hydrolase [Selenomonadales bacterium]
MSLHKKPQPSCLLLPLVVLLALAVVLLPPAVASAGDDARPSVKAFMKELQEGYLPLLPYKVPPQAGELDQVLLKAMGDARIVGLSAAVIQGDKILWSNGYGWADLRTGREVTPDTVFRVASISKMFVATALMQQYEQGKFELDDDIGQYLGYTVRNPKYPDAKISFRHLLTHTSSIQDSGGYDKLVENAPELLPAVHIKDLLVPGGKYYDEKTFGDYAPGEQFSYSNFGTAIVASLVEILSGERFDQYCRRHIFQPLGMDASFEAADIRNYKEFGVLYRGDANSLLFIPRKDDFNGAKPVRTTVTAPLGNALGYSPAGGVRTSALDLSKFMIAHINGGVYNGTAILKPETTDLMHQMHWFGADPYGFYKQKGLNFQVTDDLIDGKRMTGHSAEAYGLIGDAFFDASDQFGLVILFNGGRYTPTVFYDIENTVAKALASRYSPETPAGAPEITGHDGGNRITVNDRLIVLPVPATVRGGAVFIPEISAADALRATIDLDKENGILTYGFGAARVVITAGSREMLVNGQKVLLPEAPYNEAGHIMVPLNELNNALTTRAALNFR